MPDQIVAPIIIGITGKRELNGKDEAVRSAIEACFNELDKNLSASSKLLLSGLASGVDTIAAQLALDRGWKVIAVLPFALDIFEQDFDAAGVQQLRAFVDPDIGLLADPKKGLGRVKVLDILTNPKTKTPFSTAELVQFPDGSNGDRNDHYEQVGLFIADCSAIMLAVMPATELPDRIGGTARIVDYHLHGTRDKESRRIVNRSQILRKASELDAPSPAPVMLIDLESVGAPSGDALNSVDMWEFEPRHSARSDHKASAAQGAEHETSKPDRAHIKQSRWASDKGLIHRFRLAQRIDAFNKLAKPLDVEQANNEFKSTVRKVEPDATSRLRTLAGALSIIQVQMKRKLTWTVRALTVPFVLAVVTVELHILAESPSTIVAYVALLIVVLCIFGYAKSKILQQYSEDYRAVAEALRVQIAWWDAGLNQCKHRVDQSYLSGAAGSLALVRTAIRYFVDVALLEQPSPKPAKNDVFEWINGQAKYFRKSTIHHRKLLTYFEHAIWFLFIASIGMALTLIPLATALDPEHPISEIVNWIGRLLLRMRDLPLISQIVNQTNILLLSDAITPALVAILLFVAALFLGQVSRKHSLRPWRRMIEWLNFVLAFVAGLLITAAIYAFVPSDLAVRPGRWVMHHMANCSGTGTTVPALCLYNLAHNLVVSVMIIFASTAGALRFYSERLGWEAELHSYREAIEVFTRARKLLPEDKSTTDLTQYETLLMELGMSALRENEAWIRAHRVRPLEPHV